MSLPEPTRRLLREEDVAAELNISPSTLSKWRMRGLGPVYVKIGSRVFYEHEALDAYVASCRRIGTQRAGE